MVDSRTSVEFVQNGLVNCRLRTMSEAPTCLQVRNGTLTERYDSFKVGLISWVFHFPQHLWAEGPSVWNLILRYICHPMISKNSDMSLRCII